MSANKVYHFTPILGWSFSRKHTFDTCKRLYYYRYYTRFVPDPERAEIRYLLGISSIPLAIGSVTHEVYEMVLKRIRVDDRPIQITKLRNFVHQSSVEYVQQNNFETVIRLEQTEAEVLDTIEKTVWTHVEALLESDIFETLTNMSLDQRKYWLIEPGDHGETRIRGLKVYAIIDFSFILDNQRFIVDWKTGHTSDSYHKQLTTYALWMQNYLGAHYSGAQCRIYYTLNIDHPEIFEPDASDLEQMADEIVADTHKMYEYLTDIDKNIPQDIHRFPKVEEKKVCCYCTFRSICYPDWED